jgi:tRNA(Ile)-lysidine synthase
VEQFFLRLLRGAGGAGLAGMALMGPSPADTRLTLVRPLLGVTKSDLVAHALAAGIIWREDASNRSGDHLRNRLRNELLPLLRNKYQPALDATVLRAMEMVGAEAKFVETVARQWCQSRRTRPVGRKSGAGEAFTALPLAVQRKVIQRDLIRNGLEPDFDLVESLRTREAVWVSVGASLAVCREATGELRLRRSNPLQFKRTRLAVKLVQPKGAVSFDGRNFQWRIGSAQPFDRRAPRPALTERFDADKVGGQIILRHWRAGDRFQPIGMSVPVKLQDLFVNTKVPASLRRRLVLATTKTGVIFWVETLRIAGPFKITPQTRRQLTWRLIGEAA